MEPYYQDDFITLYHGDCLQHLDMLDQADVMVTDPPYGRAWKQGFLKGHNGKHLGIANDLDTLTRDNALSAWGTKPAIAFGDLLLAPPANTKQVLIYRKPSNAGLRGAMAGYRRDVEAVYLIGKGWSSGLGGGTSVLTTNATHTGAGTGLGGRTGHPHEKPLDVMETLIMATDLAGGGTIVDPFAGSGSTLRAAKNLGRKCIGFEIEEKYCEITAKRLAQEVLFVA